MDRKRKSDCIAIFNEDNPNYKKALPTDFWAEVEDSFFNGIDLPQVSHGNNSAALVVPRVSIYKKPKSPVHEALTTDFWEEVEDSFFNSIDLPQVSHAKNSADLVVPRVSIYKKPKSPVHEAWLGVLDSLGEVNTWGPMKKQYRNAFWSELHYKDRLLIASLCYQNGDDMHRTIIFLQTVHQDGQRNTKLREHRIIKMKQLFKYWNDETHGFERRSKYWAYDTHLRCFADLNGKPRKNQQQYVCL